MLQYFACSFVDFAYSAIDLLDLVRNAVFLIILRIFLLAHCVCDVWHDFDVFITFLWLSFQGWVIQSNHDNRNIVSWSSQHWFKQKSLRSLSIPLFFIKPRLMNSFDHLNGLFILNSVPKPITCNYNKIMVFHFKAGELGFADNYFWSWLFGLKITESSGCWKPSWENSQRTDYLIVIFSICLSNGCGLVDFTTCCNDSFLFIWVWGFVILGNLIKLFAVLTCKHSSRIS